MFAPVSLEHSVVSKYISLHILCYQKPFCPGNVTFHFLSSFLHVLVSSLLLENIYIVCVWGTM